MDVLDICLGPSPLERNQLEVPPATESHPGYSQLEPEQLEVPSGNGFLSRTGNNWSSTDCLEVPTLVAEVGINGNMKVLARVEERGDCSL